MGDHVRFGSEADIAADQLNVRFTRESGYWLRVSGCRLRGASSMTAARFISICVRRDAPRSTFVTSLAAGRAHPRNRRKSLSARHCPSRQSTPLIPRPTGAAGSGASSLIILRIASNPLMCCGTVAGRFTLKLLKVWHFLRTSRPC
jgi:hypothetical protein